VRRECPPHPFFPFPNSLGGPVKERRLNIASALCGVRTPVSEQDFLRYVQECMPMRCMLFMISITKCPHL